MPETTNLPFNDYVPEKDIVDAHDLNSFNERITKLEALQLIPPLMHIGQGNSKALMLGQRIVDIEWIQLYDKVDAIDGQNVLYLGNLLKINENGTHGSYPDQIYDITPSDTQIKFRNILGLNGSSGEYGLVIRFTNANKEWVLIALSDTNATPPNNQFFKWVQVWTDFTGNDATAQVVDELVTFPPTSGQIYTVNNPDGLAGISTNLGFIVKYGFGWRILAVFPSPWIPVQLNGNLAITGNTVSVTAIWDNGFPTPTFTAHNNFSLYGESGDEALCLFNPDRCHYTLVEIYTHKWKWVKAYAGFKESDTTVQVTNDYDGGSSTPFNVKNVHNLWAASGDTCLILRSEFDPNDWRVVQVKQRTTKKWVHLYEDLTGVVDEVKLVKDDIDGDSSTFNATNFFGFTAPFGARALIDLFFTGTAGPTWRITQTTNPCAGGIIGGGDAPFG